MAAEIQTLPDGTEALIVTEGNGIEIFPLDVIGSYSELLGEPDPSKTVLLIRGALKTTDHTGLWGPLYEDLMGSLRELVDAGVPDEFMPDLMEEATGSPLPKQATRKGLRDKQAAAKDKLGRGSSQNVQQSAQFNALLHGKRDRIKSGRAKFLGEIAPPRREAAPPDPETPLARKDRQMVDRLRTREEGMNGSAG